MVVAVRGPEGRRECGLLMPDPDVPPRCWRAGVFWASDPNLSAIARRATADGVEFHSQAHRAWEEGVT